MLDSEEVLLQEQNLDINFICDKDLKSFTTWKIGGKAKYFFRPKNLDQLIYFYKNYDKYISHNKSADNIVDSIPTFFLGLGSNVLISDNGIDGLIIVTHPGLSKIEILEEFEEQQEKKVLIRAEAGVPSPKLAKFCQKQQYSNLEFFAGIPGTIGGALVMNAGAFGSQTYDHLIKIELLTKDGKILIVPVSELEFGYRYVKLPKDCMVIAGHFQVSLKTCSANKIAELLKKRNLSQPIGQFSCGSVFKNPEGNFAGKLIEDCGLKGMKIGGAQISNKHANFIINVDNAKAEDIRNLVETIKKRVYEETGILLEHEFHFLEE